MRYDRRPWDDVELMDRDMIDLWNDRVSDSDDVYVIGDFVFGNAGNWRRIGQLEADGADLLNMGFRGAEIGETLKRLLECVMRGEKSGACSFTSHSAFPSPRMRSRLSR